MQYRLGMRHAGLLPGVISVFCVSFGAACAPSTGIVTEQTVIVPSTQGPSRFAITGTTAEFGRYVASGEITFVEGAEAGTLEGTGVAVVHAESGDQIVADVSAKVGLDDTADVTFHWRDSVTFADGTVVSNSGRFTTFRPAGLVVLDITSWLVRCILFPRTCL